MKITVDLREDANRCGNVDEMTVIDQLGKPTYYVGQEKFVLFGDRLIIEARVTKLDKGENDARSEP